MTEHFDSLADGPSNSAFGGCDRAVKLVETVNYKDAQSRAYWCKRFGCLESELLAAVEKVGLMAEAIAREIEARQRP